MAQVIADTYEVIEKIGAGGGGTVYLAKHLRLNKKVILKADKRKITTRPDLLRREVDVLKDLRHPYIPQVYDFFVEDDIVYTAMDYIEGESLDRPLRRGERFPQATVIKWAKELLQALDYLHSPIHGDPPRGYTHSDIKPANLMRTPQNDVVLIDFNIALAIGEANVIGRSAGYASPEHYGLDFTENEDTLTVAAPTETVYVPSDEITEPAPPPGGNTGTAPGTAPQTGTTSSHVKIVTPDVRSDIYSVGATLYHLLSGRRPAINAKEVVRLPDTEFSPQIVAIIAKAMEPNPDRRYQTAAEMLAAFEHLWQNDPRTVRLKRQRRIACAVCGGLAVLGAASGFIGLKRMQTTESWLKLAEYSANALQAGDREAAAEYALQAIPARSSLLTPPVTAQAQFALANALGVYDLNSGFDAHVRVELPGRPAKIALSPAGTRTAAKVDGQIVVFDTESGEQLAELPADASALADMVFAAEDVLVYAAPEGLQAYSLPEQQVLWTGGRATSVTVSEDGAVAAAAYKEDASAVIYDVKTGTVLQTVTLPAPTQPVGANDTFADADNDLLALNADGTWLAVSSEDGQVQVLDLRDPGSGLTLFEAGKYWHFEGGFSGQYLALAASGDKQHVFTVIDIDSRQQVVSGSSTMPYLVQADSRGICLAEADTLVKVDPENNKQEEIAFTAADIKAFQKNGAYSVVAAADDSVSFFGPNARMTTRSEEQTADFVALAGPYAVTASRDSPALRIQKLQNHEDAIICRYDPAIEHNETRLSADGKTLMLYRYDQFQVLKADGTLLAQTDIPNADQVYDQRFVRDEADDRLEVIYYSGLTRSYSARDGTLLDETEGEPPEDRGFEEYFTDALRIEAPTHGAAAAYDRGSGKEIAELAPEDYVTNVTQTSAGIIVEYITTQGERYGLLMNEHCETLARLPGLCDILADETLLFDDMQGNVRQSRLYTLPELVDMAKP